MEQRFRGVNKLQRTSFKIVTTDLAKLNPERFKRTAKLVFDLNQFALEQPATGQEDAQTLIVVVLDMHLTESPDTHHVANAACVDSIRFLCPGICQVASSVYCICVTPESRRRRFSRRGTVFSSGSARRPAQNDVHVGRRNGAILFAAYFRSADDLQTDGRSRSSPVPCGTSSASGQRLAIKWAIRRYEKAIPDRKTQGPVPSAIA